MKILQEMNAHTNISLAGAIEVNLVLDACNLNLNFKKNVF